MRNQPVSLWTASQREFFRRRRPTAPGRVRSCVRVLPRASRPASALSPTMTLKTSPTAARMSSPRWLPARDDVSTSAPTSDWPPPGARRPGPSTASRSLSDTNNTCQIQQQHAPLRVHSAVQRRQSPERPISDQISSLIYPKIQRRQIIMNVLSSKLCAAAPVVTSSSTFKDGLASICFLIHSCKMPRESETMGLDGCMPIEI